jgi:hypothetical protein
VATVLRQDLHTFTGHLLGTAAFTSILNGSLGLDWALIEIRDDGFLSVNTFSIGDFTQDENRLVQISGLVQTLPTSRSPVLALVERDSLTGTISGTAVSVRLPGSSKMCEIWTVHLDGNIGTTLPTVFQCLWSRYSNIFNRTGGLWFFSCRPIQRECIWTHCGRQYRDWFCLYCPRTSHATRHQRTFREQI